MITKESVKRAARTFLIAFLGLLIPGLLGWLNLLTEWASAEGQKPFPDARSLAYLGVSAIVAGVIAVVNVVWNAVEDTSGHGMMRDVPPRPGRGSQAGRVDPLYPPMVGLAVVVVVALIAVLL